MIIEALKAFLIGIVEGITEWLPISSTGHMILVDEFVKLQVSDEFLALFLVVIQLGAIMAVLILYFHKLNPFSPKKDAVEKKSTWRLWGMVAIGCIPAAVIGLLFDDLVNEYFYNKVTVAAMLILYGVVFIVLERRNRRRLREAEAALEAPRGRHARVSYGDVSDEAEARCSRSPTWTRSTGKPRSRSAASRYWPSSPAPAAPVPPSSAACWPAVRAPRRPSSRSSWPFPSCSAGVW